MSHPGIARVSRLQTLNASKPQTLETPEFMSMIPLENQSLMVSYSQSLAASYDQGPTVFGRFEPHRCKVSESHTTSTSASRGLRVPYHQIAGTPRSRTLNVHGSRAHTYVTDSYGVVVQYPCLGLGIVASPLVENQSNAYVCRAPLSLRNE